MKDQKVGGAASLLSALAAVASAVVGLGVLGPAAAADPAAVAALATSRPGPLLVQEWLKLAAAALALGVALALDRRLRAGAPRSMSLAAAAGITAAVLLAAAGVLGLAALEQAGRVAAQGQPGDGAAYVAVSRLINRLGLAAVFAQGWWYFLASWVGLHTGRLPRALCVLGLVQGVASVAAFVVPPVALLVLLLGLVWSVWLGLTLLRTPATPAPHGRHRTTMVASLAGK